MQKYKIIITIQKYENKLCQLKYFCQTKLISSILQHTPYVICLQNKGVICLYN